MEKGTFIVVMRTIHNALFKLHTPQDPDEIEILNDLVNTYISMIAGFHQYLYETLRTFLLSKKDITDEEFADLYDTLTVSPERDDN